MPLPECGYFAFNTFKEAEQHLYNYVDYVRDFRDKQFILDLHNRLHRMNPSVFPK
jgi:hypothetical protein